MLKERTQSCILQYQPSRYVSNGQYVIQYVIPLSFLLGHAFGYGTPSSIEVLLVNIRNLRKDTDKMRRSTRL